MSREYQPQPVKESSQNENNEQLKIIIREQNAQIEELKRRLTALEK